jgi:hypothetical protein
VCVCVCVCARVHTHTQPFRDLGMHLQKSREDCPLTRQPGRERCLILYYKAVLRYVTSRGKRVKVHMFRNGLAKRFDSRVHCSLVVGKQKCTARKTGLYLTAVIFGTVDSTPLMLGTVDSTPLMLGTVDLIPLMLGTVDSTTLMLGTVD